DAHQTEGRSEQSLSRQSQHRPVGVGQLGQERDAIMRRPHDIGGLQADDIDTADHTAEPWEKRVRVMLQQLGRRDVPVVSRDELRRGIEDLGTEEYNRLSYHERWAASITNILLQKGV